MSDVVRLRLDLASFDESPFAVAINRCARDLVELTSMASLGDTERNRRNLYELNRECSADIPGRGDFFTYEEYAARRLDRPAYSLEGTIVALNEGRWIGMSMLSDWRERGFLFNEMTGVVAGHRRRGIATALKVLGIRFARSTSAASLYTVRDPRNEAAITLNRRLGYVDVGPEEWPLTRRAS